MIFGMDINARTQAYREFCKNIKPKDVNGLYGIKVNVLTCEACYVAALMGIAGWHVSEKQLFNKIKIDDGEEIYIQYSDGIHI